jgi:lysozyme
MPSTFGIPLDGPVPAIKRARGLDLSEAQGANVDFFKIREVGLYDFVILKATEGNTYTDPDYDRNVKRAKAAGLLLGAYHFLGNQSKISEQVRHFESVALGVIDLKPWLDLEYPPPEKWKAGAVDGDYMVKRALEASMLVEQSFGAGQVVIYSYPDFMKHLPTSPELLELVSFDLAFAHYANQKREPLDSEAFPVPPMPWLSATFHQWSGDGGLAAPGVSCVVDHDLYVGSVEELRGTPAHELGETDAADAAGDADTIPGGFLKS